MGSDDGLGGIAVMVVRRAGENDHEEGDGDGNETDAIPQKIRILKNLQSDWQRALFT
jgi:hypothetical protein